MEIETGEKEGNNLPFGQCGVPGNPRNHTIAQRRFEWERENKSMLPLWRSTAIRTTKPRTGLTLVEQVYYSTEFVTQCLVFF
jgi:hypothetical protein